MSGLDYEQSPRGQSLLRDHARALAAHEQGDSTASVDELLARFDIPRADLAAFEATRSMWAGAPVTPDAEASLDHLIAVLDALHTEIWDSLAPVGGGPHSKAAEISVHDAIGWICATWSTAPQSRAETVTDVIMQYGAAPGAWVFHAAGIAPDEVDKVAAGAVKIVAILAAARGAHLPPWA